MLKRYERNREEKKIQILDYIRKNPKTTITQLQENLKVSLIRIFNGGIIEAFHEANVEYPRKMHPKCFRDILKEQHIPQSQMKELEKKAIIDFVRANPLATIDDIHKTLRLSFYKHFPTMKIVYSIIGIDFIDRGYKRTLKKQKKVIEFIKRNPTITQWEINEKCKTHVQEIFKDGIKEAYSKAGIRYPEERLKLYGVSDKIIKKRSHDYENNIIEKLKKFGNIKTQVRTKGGIIDAILEFNNTPIIVEVKNYLSKPICFREINQVNKYLLSTGYNYGIIICNKGNSIRTIEIGSNNILIIPEDKIDEWSRGPVVRYSQNIQAA